MIAAILRAQFLSLRLRAGARRGGAVFAAFTSLLFYGVWTFFAGIAELFFSDPQSAPYALPGLGSGLLFVMIYWQVAPVISASFGASLDLRKLLVYPIPRSQLFLVEVLLRVTTCAEMLLLVGGATLGLLRNPLYRAAAAPLILTGAFLFSAMNILISAGTRNMVERLFLRTRLREVMMLVLVGLAVLPQFLIRSHFDVTKLVPYAPVQFVWPWGAAAHVMLSASVPQAAAALIGWFIVAAMFSRWQFQESLRYDAASLRAPKADARGDRGEALFRLPGRFLPDPLAAMAEKELRTMARIPRIRLVYLMSCFLGIVLVLPSLRGPHPRPFITENGLALMAVYGLLMLGQITYWNTFGFDRTAAQGYFVWPVSFRLVFLAKNLSVLVLLLPQLVVLSLVARAAGLVVTPAKVIEAAAVLLIASLYWFGLGNIFSVRLPRAMNPDKMNQMSNKMQALSIWTAPLVLLPIGLAYWGRSVSESELIFAGILFIAALAGGIFYFVALDSAVETAHQRREQIINELAHADGPLSIT